jgi:toxin FitB
MAAGYLLDTNVLCETRRVRADLGVTAFLSGAEGTSLFVSVLTMGELRKGVEAKRRADPTAAEDLGKWVDGIETIFADRVLPVSTAIARVWGERSAGRTLPAIDTLIAATAISHDLTLVTRNTKDTEETGARLINPWNVR